VTDAMMDDGKIYSHPQFQGFIDALLNGNPIDTAIKKGESTTKLLKDMDNKVYPNT